MVQVENNHLYLVPHLTLPTQVFVLLVQKQLVNLVYLILLFKKELIVVLTLNIMTKQQKHVHIVMPLVCHVSKELMKTNVPLVD
jgi:hypothetical protein